MQEQKGRRGFTLIEIMVVVVIIGLLAAFAGPRIWAMLGIGQERIAKAKCKEYHDAAKTWKMVKHKYPSSLEDMQQPIRPGQDNFIRVEDDPWGNRYRLENDGPTRIRVMSLGEDGTEGTEDDIYYPEDEKE